MLLVWLAAVQGLAIKVSAPWKEIKNHQDLTELYAVWVEKPGEIANYLKTWECEQTPFVHAAKEANLFGALLNLLPETPSAPEGCKSFVQIGNELTCHPAANLHGQSEVKPVPGEIVIGIKPTAILYVEPGCKHAHELFEHLDSLIIRPVIKRTSKTAQLAGYGVAYEIRGNPPVHHPELKLPGFVKQPKLSTNSTISDSSNTLHA